MGAIKEQIGTRYGHLVVIGESNVRIRKRVCWKCQCDCGNIIDVIGTDLRTGRKTHCGCQENLNVINEIGNKYGRLIVIGKGTSTKDRHIKWKCQCECGNIIEARGNDLRQGKIQSCGCLLQESRGQSVLKDEVGNRYGKLVVIDKIKEDNKRTYWKCQCDCGNITYQLGGQLRNGQVKSCGCLKSYGEALVQKILDGYNIKYKKEVTFCDLISSKGGYPRFDFGIYDKDNENQFKFLIEFQGIQHFVDYGYFGKFQREETDLLKEKYCKDKNIKLYYINYDENIVKKMKEILNKECEEEI